MKNLVLIIASLVLAVKCPAFVDYAVGTDFKKPVFGVSLLSLRINDKPGFGDVEVVGVRIPIYSHAGWLVTSSQLRIQYGYPIDCTFGLRQGVYLWPRRAGVYFEFNPSITTIALNKAPIIFQSGIFVPCPYLSGLELDFGIYMRKSFGIFNYLDGKFYDQEKGIYLGTQMALFLDR